MLLRPANCLTVGRTRGAVKSLHNKRQNVHKCLKRLPVLLWVRYVFLHKCWTRPRNQCVGCLEGTKKFGHHALDHGYRDHRAGDHSIEPVALGRVLVFWIPKRGNESSKEQLRNGRCHIWSFSDCDQRRHVSKLTTRRRLHQPRMNTTTCPFFVLLHRVLRCLQEHSRGRLLEAVLLQCVPKIIQTIFSSSSKDLGREVWPFGESWE